MTLIIPIQSVSDVITNSSSELFVLNTKLPLDIIKEVLSAISCGFQDPIICTPELLEQDSDPDEVTYSRVLKDWFIDYNNINSVYSYKINQIIYSSDIYGNYRHSKLRSRLIQSVKSKYPNYEYYEILWNPEIFDQACKYIDKYEKTHKKIKITIAKDVRKLYGKILVLSDSDNTIPYESFGLIQSILNGKNYHLG